ncbi:glycoside hydrolase family 16 protein [bacterium]|nr:glycoside hydrolase family 16 protein [candidate division CSSED10-310 bacterium]
MMRIFVLWSVVSLLPVIVSARTIQFADREWVVRSWAGGPGPNAWSDSEDNVWVDGDGSLHLRITHVNGEWHCAEIQTLVPTTYGIHRYYLDSRIDLLNRNVVFSPFLYRDDDHEIDIEFAAWGAAPGGAPDNGNYVVQPGAVPGNRHTFRFDLNGDFTTHYLDWQADHIRFKSIHGHYPEPPSDDFLIQEWDYDGADNPSQADLLHIHFNLWLYDADQDGVRDPPSDGNEVEVVVSAADLPPEPTMTATPPVPTPTFTPSPAASPEPTPEAEIYTRLFMPAHHFSPGDTCFLTVEYGANRAVGILPLGVVLDVYGSYFFAPCWQQEPQFMMVEVMGFPRSQTMIGAFDWPAGAGTALGLRWWAALLAPDLSWLNSNLADWEFSYDEQ